jgi:hypothetical protein
MLTVQSVQDDLQKIKYYFSRQDSMDNTNIVGPNNIQKAMCKYHKAIRQAHPRLYDLYQCIYVRGRTIEEVADDMGYTSEYIRRLNKQLVDYFIDFINNAKEANNG